MDKIDPQWMQKLISTGTDGASVMMGRIGGVVSVVIELAVLDTFFESVLKPSQLYNYYSIRWK